MMLNRDQFGRPLVIPPGGGKPVAYRRCTTFIDVLSDTHQLGLWKQRQVALGLSARPDLLMKVATAKGDKRSLDASCAAAMEAAGSSAKATIGTALHTLTEAIDRGEEPLIPPTAEARADIDAYRKAVEGWRMEAIEVFVVNDELKVGGTFDRIVGLGSMRFIADLKTGGLDFAESKIAMQLAVYAHSQNYNPETGERTPLDVNRERGLVIHLPAGEGKCAFKWADLKAGWEGAQLAAQVWAWRARKGLLA
jgi:hypothetical protein